MHPNVTPATRATAAALMKAAERAVEASAGSPVPAYQFGLELRNDRLREAYRKAGIKPAKGESE